MRILGSLINFVKFSIGSKRPSLLAAAGVSVMAILLAISIFVVKRSSAHGVNSAKAIALWPWDEEIFTEYPFRLEARWLSWFKPGWRRKTGEHASLAPLF